MMLSEHFSLEELVVTRHVEIDNTPSPQIVENLHWLAENLEAIRKLLRVPMTITSGYRCPTLNKLVGGAANSDHMQGLAADFLAPAFGDPLHVCREISLSGIPYQQLILEFDAWTHCSFHPPGLQAKRQRLTYRKGQVLSGIIAKESSNA